MSFFLKINASLSKKKKKMFQASALLSVHVGFMFERGKGGSGGGDNKNQKNEMMTRRSRGKKKIMVLLGHHHSYSLLP